MIKNISNVILLVLFGMILITMYIFCKSIICFRVNIYEMFLITSSISIFVMTPLVKLVQIIEQKIQLYVEEKKHNHDFNIEYYRDILEKYPVPVLNLCMSRKNNYKDEMVATLIAMEIDGRISFENGKVVELVEDYSVSEKNIIRAINGDFIYGKNKKKNWREDAIIDAEKYNLIKTKKQSHHFITYVITDSYLILCAINFIQMFFARGLPVVSLVWVFISFFIIALYVTINNISTLFYRNEKGLEIGAKLRGLKKYLNDYSIINERKIEEVKLWNYYIIYAILFDMKGSLDKDAKEFFEKYIKKIK